MKKFAKTLVVRILGWQVRRLQRKNNFKVVAVVGSIGKTSTKLAIARVLSARYRVQYQEGNYNDIVTVPLIFFGHSLKRLFGPVAWLKIFISNERQLRQAYPFDVVVLEIGTDSPGQVAAHGKYLRVNLAVVTAITPEHMELFGDIDAVAREELSVARYADRLLVNYDLCPEPYLKDLDVPFNTYGFNQQADHNVTRVSFTKRGVSFTVRLHKKPIIHITHTSIAKAQLYSLSAAVVVGSELGLQESDIKTGVQSVTPVSGRLQLLAGLNDTTIIDDTYNASPDAVKLSLETLYAMAASQRIALLGSMNELGTYSEEAHTEVGRFCDPEKLDMVVTVGADANHFLATAAEARGCRVKKFDNPYDAGEFAKRVIQPGAVVLAKGSQNGVFAEEAVKLLLADPKDADRLVRQSEDWLRKKAEASGRG